MLTEACVFNLLQVGEMCNQDLSDTLKMQYARIPWHQIYGLRNRIVHGYDDVCSQCLTPCKAAIDINVLFGGSVFFLRV